MSRPSFISIGVVIAVASAGCGSPPARPLVVVSPTPTPANGGVAASMADDEVVAFLNGKPVSRREVADRALVVDGKNLIDQYIRWKVRQDRIQELGISNSPDEIQQRAKAIVDTFRKNQGEEALRKQLAESGLTEAQYLERFVKNAEFSERLLTEKAFYYDLLGEGSVEFDALAFQKEEDAAGFVTALKGGLSYDDAAMATLQTRSSVARWPRYRTGRGMSVESIIKSPWIEKTLFSLNPGEVSGIEQTASGFWLVLRSVSKDAPSSGSYADLKARVTDEALKGQATDDHLRAWLDRRFNASKIEYKDSFLPQPQKK